MLSTGISLCARKEVYETEVSFRSRRLLGRALEELRRGRAKDESPKEELREEGEG